MMTLIITAATIISKRERGRTSQRGQNHTYCHSSIISIPASQGPGMTLSSFSSVAKERLPAWIWAGSSSTCVVSFFTYSLQFFFLLDLAQDLCLNVAFQFIDTYTIYIYNVFVQCVCFFSFDNKSEEKSSIPQLPLTITLLEAFPSPESRHAYFMA